MTDTAMRTLILTCSGEKIRKVVVPEDWVVTYGPIAVGQSRHNNESPNVLRIYSDAGKKNLKAVFRDVKSFVDESVSVMERIVKTKKKTFNRDESNGKQQYTAEVRRTVWRDPLDDATDDDGGDDLTEEVLALPDGKSDVPF